MLVMLLGMVMEVREEQREKALLPMLVMLLGMVIEVSEEQSEKARFPMLVTPSITITFLIISAYVE